MSISQGHNARFLAGSETYFLQVNTFADLTFAEFTAEFAGMGTFSINNFEDQLPEKATVGTLPDAVEPPRSVDYSRGQCVTPVNYQLCNSCAAQVGTLALYRNV